MHRPAPHNPAWRVLRHLEIPADAQELYGLGVMRVFADQPTGGYLSADQADTTEALWALERWGCIHAGERRRILSGDLTSLERAAEPTFDVGYTEILSWSRPARTFDAELDQVIEIPSRPLFEISVTRKTKRGDGTWRVNFDVVDRRQNTRLVRRKPPVYDADLMREDQDHEVKGADEEAARLEGSYTTNHRTAVDELEAVDDDELARQRKASRERWDALRTREQQRSRVKAVAQRIRQIEATAATNGVDPSPLLEEIEVRLEHFEREIGVAA